MARQEVFWSNVSEIQLKEILILYNFHEHETTNYTNLQDWAMQNPKVFIINIIKIISVFPILTFSNL